MKTASEIRSDVTKDIHISILKDTLADLRAANVMMKKTIYLLCFMLMLAISGIIGLTVYHQHKLFYFMENMDFTSEVNMSNTSSNSNNMNVERK